MKGKYNMQIKYELDEDAYAPMRAHDSDAGFDLACKEDQMLEANKANTIDTGVHVLIPEGYVGLVCPRSSFNIKVLVHLLALLMQATQVQSELFWNLLM